MHTNSIQARKKASYLWRRLRMYGAAAAVLCFLVSPSTQAAIVTYELSIEFSGATPPEGAVPWLTARLDDHDMEGTVDLTLEATNLTDKEFVFEWLFNLDPDLDPTSLVFSDVIATGTFTEPTINLAVNSFMANGDGYFDVQVLFDESDGGDRRFGVGEAAQYTIEGIPTLTAYSFDFLSELDGHAGVFPTAAHVGGIGSDDDDSGWVSIPEPATLSVLAIGGLALLRRKRG